jgi:metal transporter CNNM
MEYIIVIFFVFFSALFSGLTLGFFSLDKSDLKRKAELKDPQARKVIKIRENGNLLLCTLLIGNVAVNSTLAIFLGSIASGFVAGLISTALIVIFGEIIPQATFSRHALALGAKLSWLVRIFIFIFYPICKPISMALDKILGAEIPTVYSKRELMRLVEDHEDLKESDIDEDEEKIIKGALSFSNKTVQDIMTPRTEIFSLSEDEKLTETNIQKIFKTGHSRIPVYKKDLDEVVGILYVKDLVANKYKGKIALNLLRKNAIFVDYDKKLDDLLNAFKKTRQHLFLVLGEYGGIVGLVTIEDVLEEIIGQEIVDEYDEFENLQEHAMEEANKKKYKKV